MSEQRPDRCGVCRFWENFDPVNTGDDARAKGACHRYPKKLLDRANPYDFGAWEYPMQLADEWCGEYQPKEPGPATAAEAVENVRRVLNRARDAAAFEAVCKAHAGPVGWNAVDEPTQSEREE